MRESIQLLLLLCVFFFRFDQKLLVAAPAVLHGTEVNNQNGQARSEYDPEPKLLKRTEFNYRYALEYAEKDKLKVKIGTSDPKILEHKDSLFVVVKYFDLSEDDKVKEVSLPVKIINDRIYFELGELASESVYQMDVSLYRTNPEKPEEGIFVSNVGTYRGVTSGDGKLAQARHKMVTSLLLEENDWRVGRTGHWNAPYAYGRWLVRTISVLD